jgi:hypothetical protein
MMNRISLICTVHKDKGMARVSELRAALERIQPSVIFVEIPTKELEDFFATRSRENLESNAVTDYRKSHTVDIVPVDSPTPDAEFFRNNKTLFEWVEDKSHVYRHLIDLHSRRVSAYGFAYLNSEYCDTLWEELYAEVRNTVEKMGDTRMRELHDLWINTIERRDKEMMENILDYCRPKSFGRGVFLVGASHRRSIVAEAIQQSGTAPSNIRWDLSGWDQKP